MTTAATKARASSRTSQLSPLLGHIQTKQDLEGKIYALPTNTDIKDAQFRYSQHSRVKVTLDGLPADAPDVRLDVVWLKRHTRFVRYYTPGMNGRGEDCKELTSTRCNDPKAAPLFLSMSKIDQYGESACVYMLRKKTPYLLLDYDNLGRLAYIMYKYPDVLKAHDITGKNMNDFLTLFYNNYEPGFEEYITGKIETNRNVTQHKGTYYKNRISTTVYDYPYFRNMQSFVEKIGCHGIVSPPKKYELWSGAPRMDFHEEFVQYDCANLTLLLSRPKAEKDEYNKYYWKHYNELAEKVAVKKSGGKTKGTANPHKSARTRSSP